MNSRGFFDLAHKKERLVELDEEMKSAAFWEDQELARKKISEANALKDWVQPLNGMQSLVEYLETLIPRPRSPRRRV